jgi:hypothetical protein
MSWAIANGTYTKTLPKAIKTRTKSRLNIKNDSTILEGWSREGNKIAIILKESTNKELGYKLIT